MKTKLTLLALTLLTNNVLMAAEASATTDLGMPTQSIDTTMRVADYDEERDKDYIATEFKENYKELTGRDYNQNTLDFKYRLSNKKNYFPEYNIKVLLANENPAGFIFYTYHSDEGGWLAINKAHRGNGYASLLLKAASLDLKSHGCTVARLLTGVTNYSAHKLYEKAGFTKEKTTDKWVHYVKHI